MITIHKNSLEFCHLIVILMLHTTLPGDTESRIQKYVLESLVEQSEPCIQNEYICMLNLCIHTSL